MKNEIRQTTKPKFSKLYGCYLVAARDGNGNTPALTLGDTAEEAANNAQLMLAASALLVALESIMDKIHEYRINEMPNEDGEPLIPSGLMGKAHQAIAKAQGGGK